MSTTRVLVCLIEGDSTVFDIHADMAQKIYQLKYDIHQRRKHRLREVDDADLLLLKVCRIPAPGEKIALIFTINIDFHHDKDSLSRLTVEEEDKGVQKLTDFEPISYFWPAQPESDRVHVFIKIQATDEFPNKKSRLVGPDDDQWDQLWLMFWGKSAPECTVERSVCIPDVRTLHEAHDETKYQYLALPNEGSFPCGLRRILITGTYMSLYNRLCEQDTIYTGVPADERLISMSHSTIITGQPGTGKTAGLSCILVWRLQQKKPTVYCSNATHAYVFTDSGVQRVSLGEERRIEALDGSNRCCGLVDINPYLVNVPSQFGPFSKRQGRVVVATPPDPRHVNAFKQNSAMTYHLPMWEWGDIYCASLLLPMPLVVESLKDMYERVGGIPRRCFRGAFPDGRKHEMSAIAEAIDQIQDIKALAYSTTGSLPFKNDVSHVIVRTEPRNDEWDGQVTNLLSGYVAGLVYERIRVHDTMTVRDSIEGLLRIPGARSWAGELFEKAVHRTFRDGITIKAVAMDGGARALSMQIKKVKNEAYGYFRTLSVWEKAGSNVDKQILHQCLIPLSSTSETIDAVYISNTVTVFMQITVFPKHDLNLEGITELVNELPFAAKHRICILFVVPDHETTVQPYKHQKIVVPSGVSAGVAEEVLGYNQYVYYFPMALLGLSSYIQSM